MPAYAPPMTIEPAPPHLKGGREPGQESPIDEICQLHGKYLYKFLLRITFGDHEEAEDVLQETLVRAWRYLQQNGSDVRRLRPWLYTVARRLAIDAARARQARPTEVFVSDIETLPAGRDDIERALLRLTVQRALMSLTRDHRQVLIEIFYRDRSARHPRGHGQVPDLLRAARPRRRHHHHLELTPNSCLPCPRP
jgi:RNA polymerase sigma-70 factor, ECF subfamily